MSAWLRSWRPLLRLAWRDVLRSKGRSALVLVLIALPVLAVTTSLVLTATAQVDGDEAVERRLGVADARIRVEGETTVQQGADPDFGSSFGEGDGNHLTPADLADVLGREVRAVEWGTTEVSVRLDERAVQAGATWLDLRDPLTEGLATLDEGRLPEDSGEVMVNRALADRGLGLGETLTTVEGSTFEVVGVGEDANTRSFPSLWAPERPAEVPEDWGTTWLVEAGDVTWEEVRALNDRGAFVLSRAVLADPPSHDELHPEVQYGGGSDDAVVAAVGLIVVMVLIEVVLLAGPAFAVTARRQARTLALMAAVGATPAQARRAVLAVAVVLGGIAALGGLLLGIGLAAALLPFLSRWSGSYPGPFDVPWGWVLGVAGCGLLAALLAAAAPAWLASRADVVAVLAGRRGEAKPSRRSPLLGLVLFGVGVALAVAGARKQTYGETWVALAAVVCVLGMVLLVPVVLGVLAHLGRRLPLPLRYAVRDAVRHRTRTVPAVAAVAATVCGVVALGISTSSDARESRETYTPELRSGEGMVTATEATPELWQRAEAALRDGLPDATVTPVVGLPEPRNGDVHVEYVAPGLGEDSWALEWVGGRLGTMHVVGEQIPPAMREVDDAERARGDAALAEGRVVVFTQVPVDADEVRLSATAYDWQTGEETTLVEPVTLPAAYVEVEDGGSPAYAVIPPAVADEVGLESATTALHVAGAEIGEEEQQRVAEVVAAGVPYADFYVERGYVPDEFERFAVWVLGALGAVLMIGGTLTVTFLALSDARPDLATLAAVGAAPRTRRAVAASYALVVGGTGAVLGALVGLVPGIAVAYPLTRSYYGPVAGQGTGPFLDIPWLMIGAVVLLLPLLTAAVVALSTRSRLPMVARVG
ncbi:ABC transporter permease [Nocardioides campestrisoli]|uniref:ABC transporter permease n=1 Tax=Nocardioides campestrisoli TaxID=2736757 RepID=UPI0015E7949B|nr:ABC transporter permease [Nocardioides campestrisoli]